MIEFVEREHFYTQRGEGANGCTEKKDCNGGLGNAKKREEVSYANFCSPI